MSLLVQAVLTCFLTFSPLPSLFFILLSGSQDHPVLHVVPEPSAGV